MTYYDPPRRRRPQQRSLLDSPVLSAILVVVVLGLIAVIVVSQGLLGFPGPTGAAVLPSAPGPTQTSILPSVAPTFSRPTPSPGPTFLTYRVTRGDSLNSIARRYHTTARSISWWNRGAYPSLDPEAPDYDPNTIRVGWMLVLLPGIEVDEENPPTPSPGPTAAPTIG
jgi:hypothetical protein